MSLEPFTTLLGSGHRRALVDSETAQRRLLQRMLASASGSPAAKALGIRGDKSFEEFLKIPARDYSFYNPLFERTFDNDAFTFGRDPVVPFVRHPQASALRN